MKFPIAVLAIAALVAACAHRPDSTAPAAYSVDTQQSALHFVTTKAGLPGAGGISEVSRFSRFSGALGSNGRITLEVDLASVETGVGIRDERLRTMLFNVVAAPKATFAAQLDAAQIGAIIASTSNTLRDLDLNGTLTLAGQTLPVNAKLRVSRMEGGSLQVATLAPIVVDANQFGLKAGVEALREVVGLNFLAAAAPVTFTIMLHAQR